MKPAFMVFAILLTGVLSASSAPRQAQQGTVEGLIQQAELALRPDTQEYEVAEKLANSALSQLQQVSLLSEAQRRLRRVALEIRAQSRVNKQSEDVAGADEDIRTILLEQPNYQVGEARPADASPGRRVRDEFIKVASEVLGTLHFLVSPKDAQLTIGGAAIPESQRDAFRVVANQTLEVEASLIDHETRKIPVSAEAGQIVSVPIQLTRVSSTLEVISAPPGVEVFINGVSKGKTPPGPPPDRYKNDEQVLKLDPAAGVASGVLPIHGIANGPVVLEFRLECYEPAIDRRRIETADGGYFRAMAVAKPSKGKVSVKGAGGRILIDGKDVGAVPDAVEVCSGDHTIEVRKKFGSFTSTATVASGGVVNLDAVARPSIIVMLWNMTEAVAREVMGKFAMLKSVEVRPLTEAQLEADRKTHAFQPGWQKAASFTERREWSSKLTEAHRAHGVAEVNSPEGPRRRLELSILASGAIEPDTISLPLDDLPAMERAISRLDKPLAFFEPAVDVQVADVQDGKSGVIAVVVGSQVDGLAVGDAVLTLSGERVTDTVSFLRAVASSMSGSRLTAQVRTGAGPVRSVDIPVRSALRLIGLFDETLLVNKTLMDLRLAVEEADEASRAIARLNLAVALIKSNACREALPELGQVDLPNGPGVSKGTVHFLRGHCLESLGDRVQAEVEFQAASASSPLASLTQKGTSIRELLEARAARIR